MKRFAILCAATLLACQPAQPDLAESEHTAPQRIVSLDHCADQYVLKLVDRDRIVALSPHAGDDYSYMRDAAAGLPTVQRRAEDVLVLQPDLVVRSYGGGPNAAAFFERAGVPVLQLGWASDIDSVKAVTRDVAAGLGVPERGEALIADMEARLAAITPPSDEVSALYVTPGGVTTGPGSLVHEIFTAAGLTNFERQAGWRELPLEHLAYQLPDMFAGAFFGSSWANVNAWTAIRHPIARKAMAEQGVVELEAAWTSCAGWYLVDAVEALADSRSKKAAP